MHTSDGVQPMEEDAEEPVPAEELAGEPGEQPVPKKQKVSGRADPSASQVRSNTPVAHEVSLCSSPYPATGSAKADGLCWADLETAGTG